MDYVLFYFFEDELVLLHEGIGNKFYVATFDANNISYIAINKRNKLKTKLSIFHTVKEIKAPCEITVYENLKDSEIELIKDLNNNVNLPKSE